MSIIMYGLFIALYAFIGLFFVGFFDTDELGSAELFFSVLLWPIFFISFIVFYIYEQVRGE